jgi:hypothetical protein
MAITGIGLNDLDDTSCTTSPCNTQLDVSSIS